jgi:hypothetical protein
MRFFARRVVSTSRQRGWPWSCFIIPRLRPGDQVREMFARTKQTVTAQALAAIRSAFGVDTSASLFSEYGTYLGNVLHGQLGYLDQLLPGHRVVGHRFGAAMDVVPSRHRNDSELRARRLARHRERMASGRVGRPSAADHRVPLGDALFLARRAGHPVREQAGLVALSGAYNLESFARIQPPVRALWLGPGRVAGRYFVVSSMAAGC